MDDQEFFTEVDMMLKRILSTKTLKELCQEFEQECRSNHGKYKNNFNLALEMGEKGELIVRKFLEEKGYIFLLKCEDNSYDYKFLKDGKECLFEIKTDVAHILKMT
jgi:Asp-tRNA(Asn)/Glu-tRNA(Gln) amidotransferase B subunit